MPSWHGQEEFYLFMHIKFKEEMVLDLIIIELQAHNNLSGWTFKVNANDYNFES
jgi:hypothetical protein